MQHDGLRAFIKATSQQLALAGLLSLCLYLTVFKTALAQTGGVSPELKFVLAGDSLTTEEGNPYGWTSQIREISSFFRKGSSINVALNGETAASTLTYRYDQDIHPQRPLQRGQEYYFFIWAGTNDIQVLQHDPITIYNDLKRLWLKGRLDGFKVVAFTLLWRGDLNSNEENVRQQLNKLILTDPSLYDYVVRADLILNQAPKYFRDTILVHPNQAGNLVIASVVTAALAQE